MIAQCYIILKKVLDIVLNNVICFNFFIFNKKKILIFRSIGRTYE